MKASDVPNKKIDYDSIVYVQAITNADYPVAMNALYYMMAKKPSRSLEYQDSLTQIYYLAHEYQKCIYTGNEVLSKQQDNLRVMELIAMSERLSGNIKSSLEVYEKLYQKTLSPIHAYYITEMQYYLQRYGECLAGLEKIISSNDSKTMKIELVDNTNAKQMVSLEAASYNIKGMVYSDMGKIEEAKTAFKNALLLQKNFALAQSNLDQLSKK